MLFQWTSICTHQFRLLQRRLPLPDGTPSYVLKTFTLSSPTVPPYAAILYRPDPASKKDSVILNGRSFSLAKTAYDALKQAEVKNGEGHEYLWIDALCVRMSDEGERRRQEAMTRRIFEGANDVVAWMGEETPGIHAFCQVTQAMEAGNSTDGTRLEELETFMKSFHELGLLTGKELLIELVSSTQPRFILYTGNEEFEGALIQKMLEVRRDQKGVLAKGKGTSAMSAF